MSDLTDTTSGMQSPDGAGKPGEDQPGRQLSGPRTLGAVMATLVRPVFLKRGQATAQLSVDWALIVGPRLAAETTPRQFSAGILTVACTGPVALELQHLSESLLGRINLHVGHRMVQRIRFVQNVQATVRAMPVAKRATVRTAPATEAALASIPAGPLRDALASLGRAIMSEQKP